MLGVWCFFWKGRRASPGPRAPRSGPWGAGTSPTLTPGHRSERKGSLRGFGPQGAPIYPLGILGTPTLSPLSSSLYPWRWGRGVGAGGGGRRPRPGPPSGRSAAAPPVGRRPRGHAPRGMEWVSRRTAEVLLRIEHIQPRATPNPSSDDCTDPSTSPAEYATRDVTPSTT